MLLGFQKFRFKLIHEDTRIWWCKLSSDSRSWNLLFNLSVKFKLIIWNTNLASLIRSSVKIFFLNCILAVLRPTLGHYRGATLTHSMLISFLHIRLQGHQERRNEFGSLSLAEHLVRFKPGTFRFWSQRLYTLCHSPQSICLDFLFSRPSSNAFRSSSCLILGENPTTSAVISIEFSGRFPICLIILRKSIECGNTYNNILI